MFSNSKYIETLYSKNQNMQQILNDAIDITNTLFKHELKDLDINSYKYIPEIAVEELGIDLELVNQLVEDYINQILKSNAFFVEYIEKLQDDKENNKDLDYKDLRELAHKNLGVARNLRIEDAEKLLYKIMREDDLDYIFKCLEALVASAIILGPKCAYDALKLIK